MAIGIALSEILALLVELVNADSINPPGNELAVATILAHWLQARGVAAEVQPLGNNRANLLARVPGMGRRPALAFCGHMDTVPVGNATWAHPPLKAQVVGDRIYGRGTSDMKSGLAAMAAALAALAQRDTTLSNDVLLLATAGEEVDCCGAHTFVDQGAFDQVGALVIGEPTDLEIASAHKGALWVKVTIPGRAAHGSAPRLGSNAILNACRFLQALPEQPFQTQAHPLLGLPTQSPDLIHGGISANVVPDRCEVTFDIRSIPGLAHSSILQRLRMLLDATLPAPYAAESEIQVLLEREPLNTDANTPIIQSALQVSSQILGQAPNLKGMTYFTDASVIVPSRNLPTVIWGPGEVGQAHQTNEHVDIERIETAARVYEQLAIVYSSRP